MKSAKGFRKELLSRVLGVLRRHWASLGVAAGAEEEAKRIIDLEALVLLTFYAGRFDRGLLSASIAWLAENRGWLNLSRFKQLGRSYTTSDVVLGQPLIEKACYSMLVATLKDFKEPELPRVSEASVEYGKLNSLYRNMLEGPHSNRKVTAPDVMKPCLGQLYLRGMFGINARADVCLYLLANRHGSSNGIAREIGFDQKVVYRILERWVEAGVVDKEPRRHYVLALNSALETMLGRRAAAAGYMDWHSTFLFLTKILKAVHTDPWSKDPDALAAFFGGLFKEARRVGRSAGIAFPDPRRSTGAEYAGAFAGAALEMIEALGD